MGRKTDSKSKKSSKKQPVAPPKKEKPQPKHEVKKVGRKNKSNKRDAAKWMNHFDAFNLMLSPFGLRLEDIEGDGNCLFRSISDQLFGNESKHKDLRRLCAEYMEERKDILQFYIDTDEDMNFDDYLKWIKKDTNWAGYFELYCLSNLLNVNFVLILKDGSLIKMNSSENHHFEDIRTFVLAFHDDEPNDIPEHYSSVRLVDDFRNEGMAKPIDTRILDSIKPQTPTKDDNMSSESSDEPQDSMEEDKTDKKRNGKKTQKEIADEKSNKKQLNEKTKSKKSGKPGTKGESELMSEANHSSFSTIEETLDLKAELRSSEVLYERLFALKLL